MKRDYSRELHLTGRFNDGCHEWGYVPDYGPGGSRMAANKKEDATASGFSGSLAFYEVTDDEILVTLEKNKFGSLAIMLFSCKFFGKIFPKSFTRISCQKQISSRFDEAIREVREGNDWSAYPICALKIAGDSVKILR